MVGLWCKITACKSANLMRKPLIFHWSKSIMKGQKGNAIDKSYSTFTGYLSSLPLCFHLWWAGLSTSKSDQDREDCSVCGDLQYVCYKVDMQLMLASPWHAPVNDTGVSYGRITQIINQHWDDCPGGNSDSELSGCTGVALCGASCILVTSAICLMLYRTDAYDWWFLVYCPWIFLWA
jgi:hypothetical protein